ncbi:MAG: ABC transporter ATP-binding protein [Candidatus Lindowbacteria bacterium]|nr:ABC transporter ATP-binding protein [Candidatus Lindowbacteria bacterium]
MSSQIAVRFSRVCKYYPTDHNKGMYAALDKISFTVPRGAFVFIQGPSGAGKSTLSRIIYGDLKPTEGKAIICGTDISSLRHGALAKFRQRIGIVHQDFLLIDQKSTLENVALALVFKGFRYHEAIDRAEDMIIRVGLEDQIDRDVIELSGGEKQRVAVARALVVEPEIIVADEPTANLDPELSDEIFSYLQVANERGATVVVSTHDESRVASSGKFIVTLKNGKIADCSDELVAGE